MLFLLMEIIFILLFDEMHTIIVTSSEKNPFTKKSLNRGH